MSIALRSSRAGSTSILFAAIWALGVGYPFWRKCWLAGLQDPLADLVSPLPLCGLPPVCIDGDHRRGAWASSSLLDNDRFCLPHDLSEVGSIRLRLFSEHGLKGPDQ